MRFALVLSVIGSAASAECPTAADLTGGIRMEWSTGGETTVRTTADPTIVEVRGDGDGSHKVELFAWGLYWVEDTEMEGTEFDFLASADYGVEPQQLPRPTAGSEVRFAEVEYRYHWPMLMQDTYRMGPPGSVTLAGCTYRAFEVTQVQAKLLSEQAPARVVKGWAYLTDLGFAVVSWYGPPEDRYLAPDVVSIETVR